MPSKSLQQKRYEDLRKELIQILGGDCYFCSSSENLCFHHVNPEESHESGCGGRDHLYKVRNDLEDGKQVELLCQSCHAQFHHLHRSAKDES